MIIKEYLSGWFALDLSSILPLELIFTQFRFSKLIRLTRMSKLYRLLKLLKLLRALRTLKRCKNVTRNKSDFSKQLFTILVYAVLYHIIACLW